VVDAASGAITERVRAVAERNGTAIKARHRRRASAAVGGWVVGGGNRDPRLKV